MGTIYVYENTRSNVGFKLIAVTEGVENSKIPKIPGDIYVSLRRPHFSSGARFGASLLALGRLDADSYEDFAVGAPYENSGEGAVYIYRGSKDFWVTEGVRGAYFLRC